MTIHHTTASRRRIDLFPAAYTVAGLFMMALGVSLVPAHRGFQGQCVGALFGFVIAMFPLLLAKLVAAGHKALVIHVLGLGAIYSIIAVWIWVGFEAMR